MKVLCSLALAMVNAFLMSENRPDDNTMSQEDIYRGIEQFSWPGRFETIADGNVKWFASNRTDAQTYVTVRQPVLVH